MADKRFDTSRNPKNPLLTAAGSGFSFENFTGNTLLMPVSQTSSAFFSDDAGEVDSFLGQDAPPPSALGRSAAVPGLAPQSRPPLAAAPQLYPVTTSYSAPPPPPTQPQSHFNTFTPVPLSNPLYSQPAHQAPHFAGTSRQYGVPAPAPQPFPLGDPPSIFTPNPASLDPRQSPNPTHAPLSRSPGIQPYQYGPPPPSAAPPLFEAPLYSAVAPSFGAPLTTAEPPAFGTQSPAPAPHLFGAPSPAPAPHLFGASSPAPAPHLFGAPSPAVTPPVFGHPSPAPTPPTFGHAPSAVAPPVASCAPFHVPPIPLPVATVAPLTAGTNTYRLGNSRRPVYAPLPGLSVSTPAVATIPPLAGALLPSTLPSADFSAAFAPILNAAPPTARTAPSLAAFNPAAPGYAQNTGYNVPLDSSFVSAQFAGSPILTPYSPGADTDLATMTPTQLSNPGPTMYQSQTVADLDQSGMVLPPSFTNLAQSAMYRPVYNHWFYKTERDSKVSWKPFSMTDSLNLEKAFTSTDITPDTKVATDGGRYDVNVLRRQRVAVYWSENPSEVRRCSWFYKGAIDARYVPYEENVSTRLEEEYKIALTSNEWHRRVEFPNGESVVLHGPNVMVHFLHQTSPDTWSNTPGTQTRPRVVKRGVDEFSIDEGEPEVVDHVLFLVHGIGSVCDLKFRSVEEVVNEFRRISLQLVQSHYRTATETGRAGRVEVLPVSWHGALHGEDTGIDRKLRSITLHSIPKLRDFTNDTLLDILFYTSPMYCQTIMQTVGSELNRLYELFQARNPGYTGGASLSGHSLGSLILFDLLYHQHPPETPPEPEQQQEQSRESSSEPESKDGDGAADTVSPLTPSLRVPKTLLTRRHSQRINYIPGHAGTGQPFINYPQLHFHPKAFFALGSPIGMFVTVRGIEILGEDFHLPTCPGFFNIFHPFDPVAYRIETLINPEMEHHRPVLIPHHKGRKRMHLELKETMARVGADLKQRLVESVRSTWNTVYQYAMFHRNNEQELEQEVDKVFEEQLSHNQDVDGSHSDGEVDLDISIGRLNDGRRVDYVLQEAPLESFNEYLSALHGHLCYWESEDTMLMILKEVYGSMGVTADSQTLQHQIPLEPSQPPSSSRLFADPETYPGGFDASTSANAYAAPPAGGNASDGVLPASQSKSAPLHPTMANSAEMSQLGMDPTAPIEENRNLGPPPMGGFVRK